MIIEEYDVYFECKIKANPRVYKIQWYYHNELLVTNIQKGIIVSNQSLVLQKLSSSRSGEYMCSATNEEGEGRSGKFLLNVLYKPYCRPGQKKNFYVPRNGEANITCDLLANPLDPVHFTWRFNNSDVLPASKIIEHNEGSIVVKDGQTYASSVAKYSPKKSSDYGTLMCIGNNSINTQELPCVFHIHPAVKPEPVTNCTVYNQTKDSLHISCLEGANGGIPQRFKIKIYNVNTKEHITRNVTYDVPNFDLVNLPSAGNFNIEIFAFNSEGRSEGFNIQTFTLKEPQKQTAFLKIIGGIIFNLQITPLLLGLACLLVVLALLLFLLARCKQPRRDGLNGQETTKPYPEHADGSNIPLNATDTESVDSLDKSPDILLDGKIADKTSSKLAKLKAANASLQSPDSGHAKDTIHRSPSKQFSDTPSDAFNGQYVQIDPLRYGAQVVNTGRPPVYRIQSGQMYLTNNPVSDEERRDLRSPYDERLYEDMIKFRRIPGTPNQMVPEDNPTSSDLYINCHPHSQAVYSSIGSGGVTNPNMTPIDWYATTSQPTHHVVNYLGGRQPTLVSRCSTPSSSIQTSDKDYLIMAPCQKATIIPKVYTPQPSNPNIYQSFPRTNNAMYDSSSYKLPVNHRISGPLAMKYERMSPEEPKSLHIRLDPPQLDTGINTGTLRKRPSPEMCEMTTDFKPPQMTNGEQNKKLLETTH